MCSRAARDAGACRRAAGSTPCASAGRRRARPGAGTALRPAGTAASGPAPSTCRCRCCRAAAAVRHGTGTPRRRSRTCRRARHATASSARTPERAPLSTARFVIPRPSWVPGWSVPPGRNGRSRDAPRPGPGSTSTSRSAASFSERDVQQLLRGARLGHALAPDTTVLVRPRSPDEARSSFVRALEPSPRDRPDTRRPAASHARQCAVRASAHRSARRPGSTIATPSARTSGRAPSPPRSGG